MHKVIINSKTFFAEDGSIIGDLLIKSEIPHSHPCGGMGICKKCTVTVNGKEELSCKYEIHSDIFVEAKENENIISEPCAVISAASSDKLAFILDIGTTTFALALVDTENKNIIDVKTDTNPQRIFGADIMSRIDYCRKNGVHEMQSVLIKKLNAMLSLFTENSADTLFVSGNTVMLHIFFDEDCAALGSAPYNPVFLEERKVNSKVLGINSVKTVHSLPSISSFIGADITAGINLVRAPLHGKYSILIDLGTNAEIVLFSDERVICTAAAAGPCFEGANITCGMSASKGAVYEYIYSGNYKTIENAPAKGICGTGLIDIMAVLVKNGIIDETGFMEAEKFRITEDVFINQNDIRQFQLAKSAIYSGILTLMKHAGISFDEIEQLYISGGFSAKINIENAVITGLLPRELKSRCTPLNNSSLLGTVKYACEKNDLEEITSIAQYKDMSADSVFSELFIENMMFRV